MVTKAKTKEKDLCVAEEEAVSLVEATVGLIDTMTSQMRRLRDQGYDVTKIEKNIKSAEKRLKGLKKRFKG